MSSPARIFPCGGSESSIEGIHSANPRLWTELVSIGQWYMWEEKRGSREDGWTYLCWARMSRSSHSTRVHLLCPGYLLLHNQPSQNSADSNGSYVLSSPPVLGLTGLPWPVLLQGWVGEQVLQSHGDCSWKHLLCLVCGLGHLRAGKLRP